jgi:hypothetical protein
MRRLAEARRALVVATHPAGAEDSSLFTCGVIEESEDRHIIIDEACATDRRIDIGMDEISSVRWQALTARERIEKAASVLIAEAEATPDAGDLDTSITRIRRCADAAIAWANEILPEIDRLALDLAQTPAREKLGAAGGKARSGAKTAAARETGARAGGRARRRVDDGRNNPNEN